MGTDADTTLADLRAQVATFVAAREWQPFHTPKNLSMSIAIEAAELMECFQWLSLEESQAAARDAAQRARVADELADVLIYCLSLSNALDLDLTAAVEAKLAVNERRYPVEAFRGRFRPPERDKTSPNE
jgi:NTP pyrophosphatase (non-canonical NTP hydrolase)